MLIESIEEYPDEYADSREPIRGQNEENHDAEQHNVRLVLVDEPEQQQTQTPNKLYSSLKQPSSVKAVEPPKRVIEETPIKLDLLSLHQQGFMLAAEIAQSVNMTHLILPRSGGMGFVVEKPAIHPQNLTEWGIWWMLVGLSEQNAEQGHVALWAGTELYQLYASDADGGEAIRNFLSDPPNMQLFPFQVLNDAEILKDCVFNDVVKLMENCRTLRKQFTSDMLWSESTIMSA